MLKIAEAEIFPAAAAALMAFSQRSTIDDLHAARSFLSLFFLAPCRTKTKQNLSTDN